MRSLVRSFEESNGAEAWRLIHNKCAPDTQNRQYALMQTIKMPVKPWCGHIEGVESGLRAWELDVGEWEHASGTALADAVKYTVIFQEQLAFGVLVQAVNALLHYPGTPVQIVLDQHSLTHFPTQV